MTAAVAGGTTASDHKIFYGHQYIDYADIKAVSDVLRSDYLTCGPAVDAVEKTICEITGAKYAVVTSNCTAALHIACMAAGIGEGDEVITTPITFAASANCALYCGARPVFADIDEKTYTIDPDSIEKCITEKTKAVIPVHYTGQAVDYSTLESFLIMAPQPSVTNGGTTETTWNYDVQSVPKVVLGTYQPPPPPPGDEVKEEYEDESKVKGANTGDRIYNLVGSMVLLAAACLMIFFMIKRRRQND